MAEDGKKFDEGESMATKKLPEELIVDILSRLPVKSLLRFRCVCKRWCALINDPNFVKLQLSQSLASNINVNLIVRESYRTYSVELDACEQQAPVELVHPVRCSDSSQYGSGIVGSCNGLLCMFNTAENIFLWNPFTRRYQIVPTVPGEDILNASISCGFGYDPITDDYKLVMVVTRMVFTSEEDDWSWLSEVLVYTLSTNSWRNLGYIPFPSNILSQVGALANSVLHWVTRRSILEVGGSYALDYGIVSFDLKDEEYRKVPLPDFVDQNFHMTVGVLGGQLCVLCNFYRGVQVELWVMKDYGVKDSWVQQFSIKKSLIGPFTHIVPVCYSKNGGVILHKDPRSGPGEWVLFQIDSHRRRGKNLRIPGFSCIWEATTCVGSLVHLNSSVRPTIGKRSSRRRKRA